LNEPVHSQYAVFIVHWSLFSYWVALLLFLWQVILCADIVLCIVFARGIMYVIDSSTFQKELKDVAE